MLRTADNLKFQFAVLLWLTVFVVQLVSGDTAEANGRYVTVTLDGRHQIRGQTEYTIYENRPFVSFKGVPYAEPPVGLLRFRAPIAKYLPRSLDALEYGNVCRQQADTSSEDCLFLNVFTPAIVPNRQLNVIVFIPGGGFTAGGSNANFAGPDFLVEKDVILVTMNYRLGAFGFVSLGSDEFSGNMALKDQQLALRWVQRHIRQFGGDPQKVTLMAGSAGGCSAHLQMLADSSKGLFQRVILMSGSASHFWSVSRQVDHRQQMIDLAQSHNASVESFADLVNWLQRAPSSVFLELDDSNQNAAIVDPDYELDWAPVVANGSAERFVVQDGPWQVVNYQSDLNVLLGYNSDEMVGEYGASYGNHSQFQNFHNNFRVFLPFKHWRECSNATAYAEVMSAIRHFYFGDAEINVDSYPQLVAMMSDIQYKYGLDKTVQHQIAHSTGQTYFYRLSLNTTLNIWKRITNTTPLLLTTHGDEICYIFRCSIFPNIYDNLLPESLERKVQTDMVNMWTDFVKFGSPTPQGIPIDFPPVTLDNHRLIDITNDGHIEIANPNREAIDFWDTLYEEHETHFQEVC